VIENERVGTVGDRFAASAAQMGELEESRRDTLRERLRGFLVLRGDERVLDAGTGTGAFALAVAPLVREVVAVDLVPELLEEARNRAAASPNVSFVEADIARLELEPASFDLSGTLRTLHHVPRPELVVAELTRLTRPGGTVLVVDQIAPVDPLAALELNRFERARDPSHTRALADIDLRHLYEANGLVLQRQEVVSEIRELDAYLDLAGCSEPERQRALSLAPGSHNYTVELGWYLLLKPALRA